MPDIRPADHGDLDELTALAARTFPLACPPDLPRAETDAFIAANLSRAAFTGHLDDPRTSVLFSTDGHGYALVHHDVAGDEGPPDWAGLRSAYLSKLYVDASDHGGGLAAALMDAVVTGATDQECVGVWLGVNRLNRRALRFYAKQGFAVVAARRFQVGDVVYDDDVLARPVARS